jgi:hypothetical protein
MRPHTFSTTTDIKEILAEVTEVFFTQCDKIHDQSEATAALGKEVNWERFEMDYYCNTRLMCSIRRKLLALKSPTLEGFAPIEEIQAITRNTTRFVPYEGCKHSHEGGDCIECDA